MIVRIRGRSMIPALRPGDWYWASRPQTIQRGDLVLIQKTELFVKRVVGLPGEEVALESHALFINGRRIDESYVGKNASLEPTPDLFCTLAPNTYCVLGDARDDSLDSRKLGPILREEIKGVLAYRLWPWG